MLYDAFNRPIRKPHLFGYGRTPASPSRIRSSVDAVGYSIEVDLDDEVPPEMTQENPDEDV